MTIIWIHTPDRPDNMKMIRIYILLLVLAPSFVFAQENYWIKTDSLFKYVQPVASLQFWSTYTMGEKAQLLMAAQWRPCKTDLILWCAEHVSVLKANPIKN
jgi:hypothetical protein